MELPSFQILYGFSGKEDWFSGAEVHCIARAVALGKFVPDVLGKTGMTFDIKKVVLLTSCSSMRAGVWKN